MHGIYRRAAAFLLGLTTVVTHPVWADDMELYVAQKDSSTQHARVLILFDESASMSSKMGTSNRLAVAKSAIISLMNSTSNVDWGLAVFNLNNSSDTTTISDKTSNGGRIVQAIKSADETSSTSDTDASLKTAIITKINSLTASTNTPLAETMYEIAHYFQGKTYWQGKYNASPVYDPDAFTSSSSSTYKSPLTECNYHDYLIIVTDGAPTVDTAANTLIQNEYVSTLSPTEKAAFGTKFTSSSVSSWMPAVAGYMKNKDLLTNVTGTQTVTTYTIGFGNDAIADAQDLLEETASRGGGSYYAAADADSLASSLESILVDIKKQQYSMVSVATGSSSSDKTQYLTNLYYSLFEPATGPRWPGNIKKLMYSSSNVIIDKNGNAAFDSEGKLQDTAVNYWPTSSGTADGDDISAGGVAEMLSKKTSRTLYTDNGSALVNLNQSNLTTIAGSASNLVTALGITSSTAVSAQVQWIQGQDVDNENTTSGLTYRQDLFADMMHAKPLVIDYGNDDIRLLAGTNSGFLHMFQDAGTSVSENWAYLPYSLIGNQITLRTNAVSATHVYGLDGTPVSYVLDKNSDGVIKASDGDKAWVFVTQRQGGKHIYALDVTSPDSPTLMWSITGGTTNFARLSYTWSTPVVTKVPGYSGPVLIFGGGYDTNKDTTGLGTHDATGNAIYIVDAETGGTKYKYVISSDTTANLKDTAMYDSIAAPVTTMDSDGDGYTDRLYAVDTGGNVWRVDLNSTTNTTWTIFKFASLGSDSTLAQDRRIFGAPVVVQTVNNQVTETDGVYSTQSKAMDAVLLGTGDRNKPVSETTVGNVYVMLRDYHTGIYASSTAVPADTDAMTISDLYDITSNPVGNATSSTKNDILVDLTNSDGWVYYLPHTGEKVFGNGAVINGILYFTSYYPTADTTSSDSCSLTSIGTTALYSINMHYGTYTSSSSSSSTTTTPYTTYSNMLVENVASYVSSTDQSINLLGTPGTAVTTNCTSGTCYSGTVSTTGSTTPVEQYEYQQSNN
jgi:type IV pilus assembly protein PilY1